MWGKAPGFRSVVSGKTKSGLGCFEMVGLLLWEKLDMVPSYPSELPPCFPVSMRVGDEVP